MSAVLSHNFADQAAVRNQRIVVVELYRPPTKSPGVPVFTLTA